MFQAVIINQQDRSSFKDSLKIVNQNIQFYRQWKLKLVLSILMISATVVTGFAITKNPVEITATFSKSINQTHINMDNFQQGGVISSITKKTYQITKFAGVFSVVIGVIVMDYFWAYGVFGICKWDGYIGQQLKRLERLKEQIQKKLI